MVNAIISFVIGTVASIICTALLWYMIASFVENQTRESDFMPFLAMKLTPKLAMLLGKIFGALLGILVTVTVIIIRANLPISSLIGGGIGMVLFILLLGGGVSKSDVIILASLIPIGAVIGLVTSIVNNWLHIPNPLK